MGKIKRNAPCPCGSGVKYKKCCLKRDRLEAEREKKRVKEREREREKEEKKAIDRRNYRTFGFIDRNNKELQRELLEEELEKEEPCSVTVLTMIRNLYTSATRDEEYEYVYGSVKRVREEHSAIYREMATLLTMPTFGSAIMLHHWDWVRDSISYLEPYLEGEFFFYVKDMIMYSGEDMSLIALRDLMRDKSLKIRKTYTPSTHGTLEFMYSIIQIISITAYQRDPMITAEELSEEVSSYLSSKNRVDWVSENILSPIKRGLPLAEEILKDPLREERLFPLGWSLVTVLSEELQIPMSRALLGVQSLQIYIEFDLKQRALPEEELKNSISSIVPTSDFPDSYGVGSNIWLLASLLEVLPFYLHLLKRVHLLSHREADSIFENGVALAQKVIEYSIDDIHNGTLFYPLCTTLNDIYDLGFSLTIERGQLER